MSAFALDLAPDGIRFLSRDGDAWTTLESARLDDADLAARMAAMRDKAVTRAGDDFQTALIIPESVILYTTVDAPDGDTPATEEQVAAALDGLTPCPVDEMVFDWRQTGDKIQVAALDINTLDEAEEFAVAHGLNPCGFTARPTADQFPAAPDFGPTQFARVQDSPVGTAEMANPAAIEPPEPVVAEPVLPPIAAPAIAPAVGAATPPPQGTDTVPAGVLASLRTNRAAVATAAGVLGSAAILVWSAFALMAPNRTVPDSGAVEFGTTDLPAVPGLATLSARAPSAAPAPDLTLPAPDASATPRPGLAVPVPETGTTPAQTAPERALAEALPVPDALRDVPAPLATAPTLPPLEPTPQRQASLFAPNASAFAADAELPPPIEFAAVNAAGVWQTPPPPATTPAEAATDDIYVASIDPRVDMGDAFALTPIDRDLAITARPGLLPGPGQIFDIDDRGLVRATRDGAVSPEGIVVTDGRPDLIPPARPESSVPDTSQAIALALAGPRPRVRPGNLVENAERARLGGRTAEELEGLRASDRPPSEQETALAAAPISAPSAQAIAQSPVPSSRPSGFDNRVASIRNRAAEQQQAAQVAAAAAAAAANQVATAAAVAPAQPTIPTTASVARQATIDGALNLRRLNLIGVYGSDTDRRALIRLSSGRYVKVRVGDSIDGGQVAAIGDSELRLIKGGRDVMLTVPQG